MPDLVALGDAAHVRHGRARRRSVPAPRCSTPRARSPPGGCPAEIRIGDSIVMVSAARVVASAPRRFAARLSSLTEPSRSWFPHLPQLVRGDRPADRHAPWQRLRVVGGHSCRWAHVSLGRVRTAGQDKTLEGGRKACCSTVLFLGMTGDGASCRYGHRGAGSRALPQSSHLRRRRRDRRELPRVGPDVRSVCRAVGPCGRDPPKAPTHHALYPTSPNCSRINDSGH